ncbi:MAG: 5'-nucleotidase C-terminal domain-containing protein [Pseudomonadota bacterium]
MPRRAGWRKRFRAWQARPTLPGGLKIHPTCATYACTCPKFPDIYASALRDSPLSDVGSAPSHILSSSSGPTVLPPHHRFTARAGPSEAHLRILATSDLHMRLIPHDYIADRPVAAQGLALAGSEAVAARGEAANSLLFDVGDAFEGSPVDGHLADALPDPGHPMMAAFVALGVDALTLGNHDFNHGLPALERAVMHGPVPITLANIVRRRGATPLEDSAWLPQTLLLKRRLVCGDGHDRAFTLGVIGVVPPQTLDWDRDKIGDVLEARDIVETVAAWAPELRRRGADLVAVLCHSGIGAAEATPRMEHAAVPVAAVPEVDLVLTGHAHQMFPHPSFSVAPGAEAAVDARKGTLHGKPAVMPGFWGQHLGVIDLQLEATEAGWVLNQNEAHLRTVQSATPHAGVMAAVDAHHQTTLREVCRSVGRTQVRLDTYFAQVADVPAVQLVNAAQGAAVAAALTDRPEGELPVLSATAPLRAGGLQGPHNYTDVPPGEITQRHVVDLYVYPNTLAALRVSGRVLRLWLERSASVFHTIPTGSQGHDLLDPRQPAYGYDIVSGVTYQIDLAAPPLFDVQGRQQRGPGRIVELCWQGQPVRDTDAFVLATNSYRLGHGSNFPIPADAAIPLPRPEPVRDVLTRYLSSGGAERPLPRASWGFVPQPGTTARLATGAGAALADVPGADAPGGPILQFVGLTADAYRAYALDLARADGLGPFLRPREA